MPLHVFYLFINNICVCCNDTSCLRCHSNWNGKHYLFALKKNRYFIFDKVKIVIFNYTERKDNNIKTDKQ